MRVTPSIAVSVTVYRISQGEKLTDTSTTTQYLVIRYIHMYISGQGMEYN